MNDPATVDAIGISAGIDLLFPVGVVATQCAIISDNVVLIPCGFGKCFLDDVVIELRISLQFFSVLGSIDSSAPNCYLRDKMSNGLIRQVHDGDRHLVTDSYCEVILT